MATVLTCETPTTNCNPAALQDPITQRYLLMHLLASLVGGSTDDATLKTAAAGWLCEGSASKLRLDEAVMIEAADLAGADLTHITCWDPLELEAVFAYLVCSALNVLAGPT